MSPLIPQYSPVVLAGPCVQSQVEPWSSRVTNESPGLVDAALPGSHEYLMAAANAADPKTERNRLGGSGRVGPSRAE